MLCVDVVLQEPNPALKRDTLLDKVLYPFTKDANSPEAAKAAAQSYYDYVEEKKAQAESQVSDSWLCMNILHCDLHCTTVCMHHSSVNHSELCSCTALPALCAHSSLHNPLLHSHPSSQDHLPLQCYKARYGSAHTQCTAYLLSI